MTKKEEKKRAITFYSQKNKQVMTVFQCFVCTDE